MSLKPRPEIENLKLCPHGGLNCAELKALGIDPETVLDFSVCTNPFMPPPGTGEVVQNMAIDKYPDSEATELRQQISKKLGIPPANIVVGSGTTELIRLIALAYLRPNDSVLIMEPTYGEYETTCQIAGAKLIKQRMKAEENFALELEETIHLIREYRPRAVFLCNPNNPTGKYLRQQEVEVVSDSIGDGLLILDEAYLAFVEQSWPSSTLALRGDVVILRSMTKDYALAGLRLGYAIAHQEITRSLRRVCPPWNVNVVAQKIGSKLLKHKDYLAESQEKIREAKQFLANGLSQLGFPPLPSDTHYFLVRVGKAATFRQALLRHGIQVRDCTSFGLPEYVRVAPRPISECQKLIVTISQLKKKGELDAAK